jgi:hypothetical protein
MKGSTVRRVIGAALGMATVTLLTAGCPSPGGGTQEPATHAAGRNSSYMTVAGYWKNGLWTAPTSIDSTKDSPGYSLSFPATQFVKYFVKYIVGSRCREPNRRLGHTLLPNFQFVLVHPSTGQYQRTIAFP